MLIAVRKKSLKRTEQNKKKFPKKRQTLAYCCGANDSGELGCLLIFRECFKIPLPLWPGDFAYKTWLGSLLRSPMSLLINIFQSFVDILQFRSQVRQVATDISGHFFTAVNAFILLDVVGYFFGHCVVVTEQVAEYSFHGSRFNMHRWLWKTTRATFKIWVYGYMCFWVHYNMMNGTRPLFIG